MFLAHALMENRNGLLVDFLVRKATGTAERDAVSVLLDEVRERGFYPQTLGADKGDDAGVAWGHARLWHHPPFDAEYELTLRRYRWTHRPASRLCPQSAAEEAGRGDLRVHEDGGRIPESALPGPRSHGPCRFPRGDSLQPGG